MEHSEIAILNFYTFIDIKYPEILMQKILLLGLKKRIKGTILISHEGINANLSGSKDKLDIILDYVQQALSPLELISKYNYHHCHPFRKLRVKVKKEIIAMNHDVDVKNLSGEYIIPEKWDKFIENEDVVLIDTRNNYEVAEGSFEKALNPYTSSFKNLPSWIQQNRKIFKNKKIAMYCTGGIRCEKSTAYMKSLGYKNIFHLKGGILGYLERTANVNGKWRGKCFVFDDRILVDHSLKAN